MSKKVIGMHFVCRNSANIEELGDGWFKSGHWKVSEEHAKTAEYIALHETKTAPSYKQGNIKDYVLGPHGNGRFTFYVKETHESRDWCGDGTGEKGYLWTES
jgi:hypothetical protein